MTMFIRKVGEKGEEKETVNMEKTELIVENNTNNIEKPSPMEQDLEKKPARAKLNVKELANIFNQNQQSKPPLPKKVSEMVPSYINGRRPSSNGTGKETSAVGGNRNKIETCKK